MGKKRNEEGYSKPEGYRNNDRFCVESNDLGTDRCREMPEGELPAQCDSFFSENGKPEFLFFDDQPFPDDMINID
jgi:hypothetical protein